MKSNSLIVILVAGMGVSCAQAGEEQDLRAIRRDTLAVIRDLPLKKGIGIKGTDSSHPEVTSFLTPFGGGPNAVWELAQWGSRYSLAGKAPESVEGGGVAYSDAAKRVTFWPDPEGTRVRLEIDCSKEYTAPRKNNEAWPHLLMEQRFREPAAMKNMSELWYNLEARLLYSRNLMAEGTMDPGLHTAQINFYLTVQNLSPDSPGYRDYIWFGVPVYDFRYKLLAPYKAKDVGKDDATGKYIYILGSDDIRAPSLHSGDWVATRVDIYPFIKKAFEEAQAGGYLKNTKWEDLHLTTMNLGWEMPGTFHSGIEWKGLSLKAVLPATP